MSVFVEQLQNALNESEKVETTAKEVENSIKQISGASYILPKRPYGTPVIGKNFSLTLKYLINSKDRELVAFLNITDGTWKRHEEEQTARQEMIDRMKAQTAELIFNNQQQKLQREKDILWNQTHSVDQQKSFIRN